jgi:hypothetical protein
MKKEYLKWCSFSCFGEVLDEFIGAYLILLAEFTVLFAKKPFYSRKSRFNSRKSEFIRKLEIPLGFFQFKNKKPDTHELHLQC